MKFDYKSVVCRADNDSQLRNEVSWSRIRGDLIDNEWTFDEKFTFSVQVIDSKYPYHRALYIFLNRVENEIE